LRGLRAQTSATLAGLGAILLWSALAVLTTATGVMPPFQLTAVTFATGGLAGLAVLAWRGEAGVLAQPPAAWALGTGGLFLYHALYFGALRTAPSAEAGLVNYLWPLLIVLFSALLPGESLRLRHVAGALTGLAGLVVLFVGKGGGFSGLSPGYALAFAAAFVWAGYSVASRRFAHVPSGAVAGFCLATSLLAGALHLATERTVWPENPGQWAALALLGLGPAGAAFFLWDHGVKRGDIRLLGVLSYAAPVLSTLWLVAAGQAEAGWPLAAACALIVAGAVVASGGLRPKKKPG
jgi:drug/metabolite transporter (DMT)-like permease